MLKKVFRYSFQKISLSVIIIILGTIVWSVLMIRSGRISSYGMGFWGPNAHDGVWHLALAKSLSSGSLENPVLAGERIKNYHIGFDLMLGYLSRFTGVDASTLYFQILPPIFALLIGLLTYKLVMKITNSESSAFWSVIFVYFSGGFGPIVHLIRFGRFGGDSMFWAQTAATTLINPSLSLSLILLLLLLYFLEKFQKSTSIKNSVFISIFLILIVQIKVYAGLICFAAILVVSIINLIKNRSTKLLFVFIFSSFVTLVLYLPLNKNSSNMIVFSPFWFLETMMLFGDRLNWGQYFSAMNTYRLGHQYFKFIVFYLGAFVIFMIGNLGARIAGLFWIIEKMKKINKLKFVEVFIVVAIVCGSFVPLLFVQRGTAWNTIQFFYYSLFLFSIISGISVADFFKKKFAMTYNLVLGFVVISFSVLVTSTTLMHYTSKNPHTYISSKEMEALNFLKNIPDGVVLELQIKSASYLFTKKPQITPIYLYDSTAYIPAISGKKVFFADEVNLNIMGYNWMSRKKEIEEFLIDHNSTKGSEFLKKNNITYIYFVKTQTIGLSEDILGIKNIYDNDEVILYKVI